ncbi:hypothetical protein O181_059489 [Austropuccinia psidii MF-1]|uniref:Reverse transcriptase/retrotransposon-derived protein RNase H-like domain-containing protein n=1 Tax=Austropuccinia psidii MF-1 TaxID=1389203 RepID=A0A9Q3HYP2_9BASI|nr:hypothetical protein [Austropuccinia psidii MF-1]
MNAIYPLELSEGWPIIYIDDRIKCSKSWSLHLKRRSKVLDKASRVNMKISLKKFNFGFEELKVLGQILFGLSLVIDKHKVAAVLLKPISHNKEEKVYFLGFCNYYRQHLKEFVIVSKSLYRICDQQTVFEVTKERIKAYKMIREALKKASLLPMRDWSLSFKLKIDACGDGLGEAPH